MKGTVMTYVKALVDGRWRVNSKDGQDVRMGDIVGPFANADDALFFVNAGKAAMPTQAELAMALSGDKGSGKIETKQAAPDLETSEPVPVKKPARKTAKGGGDDAE